MVVLKFEAKSPQLAQLILATLVGIYKEEHMRIHRQMDRNNSLQNSKPYSQKS
ncbi:MAG: hypothetical protein ACK5YR_22315 [Pirellula sp.]